MAQKNACVHGKNGPMKKNWGTRVKLQIFLSLARYEVTPQLVLIKKQKEYVLHHLEAYLP